MRTLATTVVPGDPEVAEWVRRRVPFVESWGLHAAIGIRRGPLPAGELLAGVVYSNFHWPTIEASIAASTPAWCSRRNLVAIFSYPFCQLECRRLGATTEAGNTHTRQFLRRLGFREEGVCRDAMPSGDAVIYGMTAAECLWLGRGA